MVKYRYTIFLTFYLFIASLSGLYSQEVERFYTHFDKEFYVAGEDLWYSVYLLNPNAKASKMLYVELVDRDGNLLSRQIHKIIDNFVKGDIALPADLTQGYYEFRAYTRWNLNFSPQGIFRKHIPIYELNFDIEYVEPPSLEAYNTKQFEGINLGLDKNKFQTREDIELRLSSDLKGDFSISVIDLRYGKKDDNIVSFSEKGDGSSEINSKVEEKYQPEAKYSRTFKIYHPDNGELINSSFVMAFVRQTQQKIIRPAVNGLVTFDFDDFYDTTIIQIFDANPFYQTVIPKAELQEGSLEVESISFPEGDLPISPEILFYIHNYQKRYQLHKLFGSQANMRAQKPEPRRSRYIPTNIYKVDDFITMENMEDFIKHTIPPLKVKKAGKKDEQLRSFTLYLPHAVHVRGVRQRVKKPPLLLVNNYFTYDVEAVLNIDWENIRQIDVYNSASNEAEEVATNLPAQFGPIGEFGVLGFHTRDGETPVEIRETANNLRLPGFYLSRTYDSYINQNRSVEDSKIPNFNPLLYWDSGIHLEPNSPIKISFPANDQSGKYLIQVEGISKDGKPLYGEMVIEVE